MTLSKMFLKHFLFASFAFVFTDAIYSQAKPQNTIQPLEKYVCSPCGQDCDKIIFDKPGTCPHCGMALVKQSTVTFKTIQPGEICNYIKRHPHVVLLDVRTREEFERKANPDYGTLQNAINIPVQELESRLTEISSLKKREIIVYCSHSHRSPQASYILSQNGFTDVTNMAGGMSVMTGNPCKK